MAMPSILPLVSFADTDSLWLKTMKGKSARFEDVLVDGKWTLVDVWQIRCPACLTGTPKVVTLAKRRDGIEVAGINIDGFNR